MNKEIDLYIIYKNDEIHVKTSITILISKRINESINK